MSRLARRSQEFPLHLEQAVLGIDHHRANLRWLFYANGSFNLE
jgi:hypothetical protein